MNKSDTDISKKRSKETELSGALQRSEMRFRTAWENSIDGMRLTDSEGTIIEVNEAYCQLVGMKKQELIGQPFHIVYMKEGEDFIEKSIKHFKESFSTYDVKTQFYTTAKFRSGKIADFNTVHKRMPADSDDHLPLLLSIFRDISEKNIQERELFLSESRFRNLVENINEVFHILDGKTKRLLYISPAYEHVWGRSCKSLFEDSQSWKYSIYPEDLEGVNRVIKDQEFKEYSVEYRIKRPDGTTRWIRDKAFPVKDEKGKTFQIVGIAEDITAAKNIETTLRESEERYRSLIETSPDTIILINRQGNVIMSNRQVASIFGFDDPKESQGKNVFEFIDFREKEKFTKHLHHVLQKGVIKNVEYSLIKKNGDILPAEISTSILHDSKGKVQVFIVVIRDISDRKFAEEALKHSELQFRSVWENSTDGMRLTDSKGYIVAVNKAFCRLAEMSQNELIGRPFFEIYSNQKRKDPKISLRIYQKRFFNKNFDIRKRTKTRLRSGKLVDLDVTYSMIEFEKGKSLLLAIFRDITEQRKAEEDLRNSEKLAAIGKMAAFLSHEIKTPLVSIKMNIDMLSKSLKIPENKKRSFEIIHKEVKRLDRLLKNVLQYSRQVDLVNGNINFLKMIDNIKEFLEPILLEREIVLENEIGELIFHGDHQKLQSVMLHLIENSIEAINEKGEVRLWLDNTSEEDYISIYIKDSGCGIESSENIFDPFFTTKSSGTGLGLSIAQKIIEQHDGKLNLLSSKKGETIFEIKLPYNRIKHGNYLSY